MNRLHAVLNDLIRLETELWNELDDQLRAAHGIGMSVYDPMRVIETTADCRVQDIASALAITVGGTSKLVDRLVAADLGRRVAHPHDRRSSIVELTETGRSLLNDARSTVESELVRRFSSPLTDPELTVFQSSLETLRESFAPDRLRETAR